jgi:hypothetical protein
MERVAGSLTEKVYNETLLSRESDVLHTKE